MSIRARRTCVCARASPRARAHARVPTLHIPVDIQGGIDLYHWSSERFSAAWRTTISVLVAKGRARVGVAASAADWPKRIRDMQFLDHEGYATAT
eukprot:COSAG02_NODE_5663_length_4144_cov_59.133251_3_plen_95_part_00